MLTNGVQRQLLSYIVAGRRELSLPLALKLESFFNLPEGKLLKMQAENNVQNYKRQLKNELADQLLRANAFWSYANVSAKNIPDEELIEKWQKWRALSRIFLRAGLLLQHKLAQKIGNDAVVGEIYVGRKFRATRTEIQGYERGDPGGQEAGLIFFHMLLVVWWFGVRCLHMARWLDRRQVSSFFTCCWLCGGLVSGVCTCKLFAMGLVQRCGCEVPAGEGDVKKGERWGLGCHLGWFLLQVSGRDKVLETI